MMDTKAGEMEDRTRAWKIYIPRKRGKYRKYVDQLVVVHQSYKAGTGVFVLPAKLMLMMGNPSFISLGTRGSNIALLPCSYEDELPGTLKVTPDESGNYATISSSGFIKDYPVKDGAYDVHMEAGSTAVFDAQQLPSTL